MLAIIAHREPRRLLDSDIEKLPALQSDIDGPDPWLRETLSGFRPEAVWRSQNARVRLLPGKPPSVIGDEVSDLTSGSLASCDGANPGRGNGRVNPPR